MHTDPCHKPPIEMVADMEGETVEGLPMFFTAYYGEDEMPVRIHGAYSSRDGGGMFDVERWEDLPWVVTDGVFHVVRKESVNHD